MMKATIAATEAAVVVDEAVVDSSAVEAVEAAHLRVRASLLARPARPSIVVIPL